MWPKLSSQQKNAQPKQPVVPAPPGDRQGKSQGGLGVKQFAGALDACRHNIRLEDSDDESDMCSAAQEGTQQEPLKQQGSTSSGRGKKRSRKCGVSSEQEEAPTRAAAPHATGSIRTAFPRLGLSGTRTVRNNETGEEDVAARCTLGVQTPDCSEGGCPAAGTKNTRESQTQKDTVPSCCRGKGEENAGNKGAGPAASRSGGKKRAQHEQACSAPNVPGSAGLCFPVPTLHRINAEAAEAKKKVETRKGTSKRKSQAQAAAPATAEALEEADLSSAGGQTGGAGEKCADSNGCFLKGTESGPKLSSNKRQKLYQEDKTLPSPCDSLLGRSHHYRDVQMSECFPRQSAREACQVIINSIQRSSMHALRKDRASACSGDPKNSSSRDADGTGACEQEEACEKTPGNGAEEGGGVDSASFSEDCSINLDHILSCVPYKDMLRDLFNEGRGQTGGAFAAVDCKGAGEEGVQHGLKTPVIPIVTKAYEESYMREPMWDHERFCIMGQHCECNFVGSRAGEGFIGVEFVLPNEVCTDAAERARGACVLCHRRLVQSLFYDIVFAGSPFKGVIQRYGNICNQEGEYAREVMLICPPHGPVECMPFPSVSHQRNRYAVYVKGGVKHIRQLNVSWQDFCQAPPS